MPGSAPPPGANPRVRLWAEVVAAEAELHELRAGLGAVRVVLQALAGRAARAGGHLAEAHRLNRTAADESDRPADRNTPR